VKHQNAAVAAPQQEIVWHALSEEDYQAKKAVYEARQEEKAKK
jgi:hypothetical protein